MQNNELEAKARKLRLDVIEAIAQAKKGHIGGGMSCMDLLVALFYQPILKFDSQNPQWPERDRFILSKGHVGSTLYAVLADLGFFDPSELSRLNQGGLLGEHPDRRIPGVEVDSGSLGHGLGIGSGMALAARLDQLDYHTVVMLGDGECYEGSTWEAALFAAHHRLSNLTAIVDRNRQIVNDFTEDANRLDPLPAKWKAFGWEVREIDGHVFPEILDSLRDFRNRPDHRPLAIIANTIKGKGVSFMEGQLAWHHGGISGEKLELARKELLAPSQENGRDCL